MNITETRKKIINKTKYKCVGSQHACLNFKMEVFTTWQIQTVFEFQNKQNWTPEF